MGTLTVRHVLAILPNSESTHLYPLSPPMSQLGRPRFWGREGGGRRLAQLREWWCVLSGGRRGNELPVLNGVVTHC